MQRLTWPRHPLLAPLPLFLLAALLLGWRLASLPLFDPDEGRYAEVPREMLASGDFVTPRLNGVLYFEKPPLYYWLGALAQEFLGSTELAARIWSALLAFGGLCLTYRVGVSMAGKRGAILALAALASSPLYLALGHLNSIDMALAFFVTLTLACFWFAHRASSRPAAWWCWQGVFLGAALAVLTKGLIGVAIPAAVIGLYIVCTWEWRVLTRVPWLSGLALFLLVAVPWHWVMIRRHPDFAWFYFIHEHVLRFSTAEASRPGPPWYFVGVILFGCVPWSGLLLPAGRLLPWRGGWRRWASEERALLFVTLWVVFVVGFFSISHSKLIPYISPALPAFALLLGITLARSEASGARPTWLDRAAFLVGGGVAGVLAVVFMLLGLGRIPRLPVEGSSGLVVLLGALLAVCALVLLAFAWRGSLTTALPVLVLTGSTMTAAVLAGVPLIVAERSSKPPATALASVLRADDLLFSYRGTHEGLAFYLRRTDGVAAALGELAFGASHLSEAERGQRFPRAAELLPIWNSSRRVFLVASKRQTRFLAQDGITLATAVWENNYQIVLCNQPVR
jgi:4-amino-4-deoxy-L-arabinose transferase-like glycosyltransferase